MYPSWLSLGHLVLRQEDSGIGSSISGSSTEQPAEHSAVACSSGGGDDKHFHLRILAIFIILMGSTFGALFPIMAKRSIFFTIPKSVFNFAKYFGSGVIFATGFIHLLAPSLEALGSECLSEAWQEYPYALALCMLSIFFIFVVELIAFRWGMSNLAKTGAVYDAHGHATGGHAAHGPELPNAVTLSGKLYPLEGKDLEYNWTTDGNVMTQAIGLAILEFGVVLHSLLIGLTLAVDEGFIVLFIVLVFHQTFEGLGLGSRLAYLELPKKYQQLPIIGAILYGLTTPLGIAIGLAVRTTYNPGSTTASIVSGVLDGISSGILIYTGLVELLAHDFLYNKEMIAAPASELTYALGCMVLGVGLMALLGKWA